jgi:hypothetical protein
LLISLEIDIAASWGTQNFFKPQVSWQSHPNLRMSEKLRDSKLFEQECDTQEEASIADCDKSRVCYVGRHEQEQDHPGDKIPF